MHRLSIPDLLFPVLVLLLVGGCSRDAAEQPVLSGDSALLEYVADETPYLAAMLEPLPDDVLDKLEPGADRALTAYQEPVRAAVLDALDEAQAAGERAPGQQRAAAVVDELLGLLSISGMRAAGIGRDATMALYGHGLLPVLRIELTDVDAFQQALADVEAEAGRSMATAAIDDVSYRYLGNDSGRLVIAVIGGHAVLSIVPGKLSETGMRAVLGLTLPARSLADSGRLTDIAAEYGFTGYGAGFIDIERIVRTFLEPHSGSNAELLTLLEYDDSQLSDICKAEIRSLAGVAPRVVTGYTEITAERIASNTVFEVREDLAAGLARLPAAVPGLGMDHGGLVSLGASIDLLAAREFYAQRLDALEAEPFACELFGDMQQQVAQGRVVLEQPVPPLVYGLKGFLAVIEDVEGLDMATRQPPTSIKAQFLLATDNAPGLVAMGGMFSPELAALDLKADGKPVRFESPQLPGSIQSAHLAMTSTALGLAIGTDSEQQIAALLGEQPADPPPAFSMHMDAASYYAFAGDAMAWQSDAQPGEEMSPDVKASAQQAMQSFSTHVERLSVDVHLTERGIEIPAVIKLSE